METKRIVFVGVGGQGNLLVTRLLGEACLAAGIPAVLSEIHGMAQRGGAVQSHLRLSQDQVYSDLIPKGYADMLLSVEPLESLRMVDYLKPDSTVIVNDYPIPPVAVTTGQADYPTPGQSAEILEAASARVYRLNFTERAQQLGSVKVVNIMLLGALSSLLKIPEKVWVQTIERYVPAKLLEVNRRAFSAGRELLS